MHVDAGDRCFEQEGRVIARLLTPERVRVDDARLEVHRALVNPLGADGVAGAPVQPGCRELVRHVPLADPFLAGWDGLAASRECEGVHR